jgi:hypothetical protein
MVLYVRTAKIGGFGNGCVAIVGNTGIGRGGGLPSPKTPTLKDVSPTSGFGSFAGSGGGVAAGVWLP